jgi:transcriptional regulator with XRE-family HTH domain
MSFRTNKNALATRLISLREAAKLSIKEAAERADITEAKLRKYENADASDRPDHSTLQRLAKAYDTSVSFIRYGIPELCGPEEIIPFVPRDFMPNTSLEKLLSDEVNRLERLLVWVSNESHEGEFEDFVDALFQGEEPNDCDCDCDDPCNECEANPDSDAGRYEQWFCNMVQRANTDSKELRIRGRLLLANMTAQDRAALELLGAKLPDDSK